MKKNYILTIGFLILVMLSFTLLKSKSTITGAQILSSDDEKFFYGTYSVNPSFSVRVDYDLNEFDEIIDNAKSIAKDCHDKDEVEKCVKEKRDGFTNENLEWKETCFEGAAKVFQEFKEFITNCANSADGNCICSYTFPKGDYSFNIDPSADSNQFKITAKDEEKTFEENLNIQHSLDTKEDLKAGNEITFLKDPETRIISKFKEGTKPHCAIPKEFYTFCVESKYEVLAYDDFRKDTKLRNVEYNFALQIKEKPPSEVQRVQVFDRPKDDTSFILKWDKNKEADVVKYRVYYAKSEDKAFENKDNIEDIKKDKNILKKDFSLEDVIQIESILVPQTCEFNYEKKKCLYTEKNVEFNYNNILFFESTIGQGFYYVSFDVLEDNKYDFLVTAIDRNGNEIKEIIQEQIKTEASIDDLPPSSEELIYTDIDRPFRKDSDYKLTIDLKLKPTINIDNTELKDLYLAVPYAVYYLKNPEKENKPKPDDSSLLNNFDPMIIDSSHIISNAILLPIGKTNPEVGDTYYIVIVAVDLNSNPNKSQFKIRELGTTVITLTVVRVDSDNEKIKTEFKFI